MMLSCYRALPSDQYNASFQFQSNRNRAPAMARGRFVSFDSSAPAVGMIAAAAFTTFAVPQDKPSLRRDEETFHNMATSSEEEVVNIS